MVSGSKPESGGENPSVEFPLARVPGRLCRSLARDLNTRGMLRMNRKHTGSYWEAGRAPRAGLLVKRGRIIAMAGVLAVAPMVTGFPQVSSTTQPHPVKSQIRQVAFVKSSVTAIRTAKNATGSFLGAPGAPDPISTARAAAVTPVQDVAGAVTIVGVTWPKGTISAKDNYQICTLKGPTWSQWEPFEPTRLTLRTQQRPPTPPGGPAHIWSPAPRSTRYVP